ncbi:MAG: ATP-grasp domain-containing protein [Sporocytophaga sp.]|nr:ATP-grasp domain-containing protein [Sporocytophaga sp.]
MLILFCNNFIDQKQVDPDFENEYSAAVKAELITALIRFEALKNEKDVNKSLRLVETQPESTKAIYRGWMLSSSDYEIFYNALKEKNIELINSPEQYTSCHYLPNSYKWIEGYTPRSIWTNVSSDFKIDDVLPTISNEFGTDPIIVKDFVKSNKHSWKESCFIPDASDREQARKVITNFMRFQGKDLIEGLVFRKFEDLEFLTEHSKSGMPLTKEYRLFFLRGNLISVFQYWDEGDYQSEQPPLDNFITVAKNIDSNFFTMDIAKKKDGSWIIMELGDGQVSGVPDNAKLLEFYEMLGYI